VATIGDVARRAGVSKVTVSRVLNGAANVNAQTRERVEQAIRDLAYLPNLAARSLRSRQTQTIALVVPDITNVFWTTVARGVEDQAQKKGYSVLLGNTDENPEKQRSYLRAVMQQRVDGVIIAPYNRDSDTIRPLLDQKIATVLIDRKLDGLAIDSVRGDSVGGAYALVSHLIGLGCQRIAMIAGPRGASTAEERALGYCLALRQAGMQLDARWMRWGEYKAAWGEEAAAMLFAGEPKPDAIFAANNQIALGVWEYLLKRGVRVPQDVALVCFDEMADSARLFPFFTVAAQPAYAIGSAAADLLFARIQGGQDQPAQEIGMAGKLVLRASCGRLLKQAQADGALAWPGAEAEVRAIPPLNEEELKVLEACQRELAEIENV